MEQFGQLESSILVLGLEDSGQKRGWKVESEEKRWKPSGEDHRNTRMKKGVRPYTKTPAETPNLRSKQMGKVYHLPIATYTSEPLPLIRALDGHGHVINLSFILR